jgi:hypothetical protein
MHSWGDVASNAFAAIFRETEERWWVQLQFREARRSGLSKAISLTR